MIVAMVSLNFADTAVTFLTLLGPQKVLLSFARVARTIDTRSLRLVAVATAVTSACLGVACALTAPWIATFFHFSTADLELSAGIVFFIYASGLVLGVHLDPAESVHLHDAAEAGDGEANPLHPFTSGFRSLLLPFVVSPLAIAAALEESLTTTDWGGRWTVAAAFVLVDLIDAACAVIFAPLLRRIDETVLEVLSRLLGILLAAVGVQLFLTGLTALGTIPASH